MQDILKKKGKSHLIGLLVVVIIILSITLQSVAFAENRKMTDESMNEREVPVNIEKIVESTDKFPKKEAAQRVCLDPETGEFVECKPEIQDTKVTKEIENALSRTHEGLVEVDRGEKKGVEVNLKKRFQNVTTHTINNDLSGSNKDGKGVK